MLLYFCMEYKKLVEYWRKSAEHDYETMLGLYRIRRYSDCLFFGHMVLEKMFKALVVRNTEKDAPYVHNLVSLAKLSGLTLDKIDLALIGQINEFNIRARYPEYKLDFYKKCNQKFTKKYYDEIKKWYKKLCQEIS